MLIVLDQIKPEHQGFADVFHTILQDPNSLLWVVDADGKIWLSNTTFQNLFYATTLKKTKEKLNGNIAERLAYHIEKALAEQKVISFSDFINPQTPEKRFAIFCFPIKDETHISSIGVIAVDATQFEWLTAPLIEEARLSISDANHTIEALQRELDEARRLATIDPLTKVRNRAQVKMLLTQEIAKHSRLKQDSSLIFIDLDNFKRINDTFGHNTGDEVLVKTCRVVEETLRPFDIVARWGGEEFLVILPNTNFSNAHLVANRLCTLIASSNFAPVEKVTASIGIATHRSGESWNDWIDRADSAMYVAKKKGKNRVEPQSEFEVVKPQIEQSSSFLHLTWNKSFECGHPVIDAQHKELFVHANALFDAFLNGKSRDEIKNVINVLLSAVGVHFTDEINILRALNYPDVDNHEKIHKEIVRKAVSFVQRFDQNQVQLGELFSFLAYEVVDMHMLQDDQKFFSHVQASRQNA